MDSETKDLVLHEDIVTSIVLDGDLSKLNDAQLIGYYYHRCESLGLDPGEKPFDLLRLDGKLVLYTTKAGSNALTRVNQLSVDIKTKGWDGGMYVVEARASTPAGRFADDIGVIDMQEESERATSRGNKCITPANAMMKAATKAKRRAILACCGLGLIDESEIESIRGAQRVPMPSPQGPRPDLGTLIEDSKRLCLAFAALVEAKPADVWGKVCNAAGIPQREPEKLTGPHLERACQWLRSWIERKKSNPVDVEVIEREPGDDREVDLEPGDGSPY